MEKQVITPCLKSQRASEKRISIKLLLNKISQCFRHLVLKNYYICFDE